MSSPSSSATIAGAENLNPPDFWLLELVSSSLPECVPHAMQITDAPNTCVRGRSLLQDICTPSAPTNKLHSKHPMSKSAKSTLNNKLWLAFLLYNVHGGKIICNGRFAGSSRSSSSKSTGYKRGINIFFCAGSPLSESSSSSESSALSAGGTGVMMLGLLALPFPLPPILQRPCPDGRSHSRTRPKFGQIVLPETYDFAVPLPDVQ